jgi:hypothetical protein
VQLFRLFVSDPPMNTTSYFHCFIEVFFHEIGCRLSSKENSLVVGLPNRFGLRSLQCLDWFAQRVREARNVYRPVFCKSPDVMQSFRLGRCAVEHGCTPLVCGVKIAIFLQYTRKRLYAIFAPGNHETKQNQES